LENTPGKKGWQEKIATYSLTHFYKTQGRGGPQAFAFSSVIPQSRTVCFPGNPGTQTIMLWVKHQIRENCLLSVMCLLEKDIKKAFTVDNESKIITKTPLTYRGRALPRPGPGIELLQGKWENK